MRITLNARGRTRRRGMTLVELLLAGTVSAITATAGATMIYAITSASDSTRDDRTTKNQGRFALLRISKAIREARAIGDSDSSCVVLWREDANQDDVVNLYELGIIKYKAVTQELTFLSLVPPDGVSPGIVVSDADFQDKAAVASLVNASGDKKTVVWAEGVESFTFSCFPSKAEARIVDVKFQMRSGEERLTFSESITPRASADYLFEPLANEPSVVPGDRIRRKHRSRWKGFYDLRGQAPPAVN